MSSGAYGAIGIPVTTRSNPRWRGPACTVHRNGPGYPDYGGPHPLLLVAIQDGLRGIREVGLVALMVGLIYSGGQVCSARNPR